MSCFILSSLSAAGLSGNVVDAITGENLIGANVSIYKNGELLTGTSTDLDGEYFLKSLDPLSYDVKFSYIGYEPLTIEGVSLTAFDEKELMVELNEGLVLIECVVVDFMEPLIEYDNTVICRYNYCPGSTSVSEKVEKKEDPKESTTESFNINYYPNPTTDLLNIVLAKATESLIIRSVNGKELLQRANLPEGMIELNVSDYAAGTYILQVVIEGEMTTKKFMVVSL